MLFNTLHPAVVFHRKRKLEIGPEMWCVLFAEDTVVIRVPKVREKSGNLIFGLGNQES